MASCCSCSFLVMFCCDYRCHTCIFLTPYFQYPILIFLDAKRTMTAFTTSGCPSITTRRHSIAICTSKFQSPPKNKYGKHLDFFVLQGLRRRRASRGRWSGGGRLAPGHLDDDQVNNFPILNQNRKFCNKQKKLETQCFSLLHWISFKCFFSQGKWTS